MKNNNRITIRFKQEVDLKNIRFIAKAMDTNPNKLIQYIIKSYIKKVKRNFEDSSKSDNNV